VEAWTKIRQAFVRRKKTIKTQQPLNKEA